jgi:hypothetical protein
VWLQAALHSYIPGFFADTAGDLVSVTDMGTLTNQHSTNPLDCARRPCCATSSPR